LELNSRRISVCAGWEITRVRNFRRLTSGIQLKIAERMPKTIERNSFFLQVKASFL